MGKEEIPFLPPLVFWGVGEGRDPLPPPSGRKGGKKAIRQARVRKAACVKQGVKAGVEAYIWSTDALVPS